MTDPSTPVAGEAVGLHDAVRIGGWSTVAILSGLAAMDEIDGAIFSVFAPEIQDSLGISTAALAVISSTSGAVFVAGAVPIARLADRTNRSRIASLATIGWALATASLGVIQNVLQFVVARIATGLGKSNTVPVHSSLLADAYPQEARGAIFGLHGASGAVGRLIGPLFVAALALVFGDENWRTVAVVAMAVPIAMALLAAVRLREPVRGAHERRMVLGEQAAVGGGGETDPIALSLAFARLRRIATFDRIATGIGVLGFAIFSVPLFISLVLEEEFGLTASQRGLVGVSSAAASIVAIPIGATFGARLFARDPGAPMRLMGVALVFASTTTCVAMFMPTATTLALVNAIGSAVASAAFVTLSAILSSVIPARLRAQGFALLGVYVFLIGGFFGSLVAGIVADSIGTRPAIPVVVMPVAILGAVFIWRAGETVEADMQQVIDDITEEAEEAERRRHSNDLPVLQVKGLRVSIGAVPILHDIELEVRRQEIVAIVGTNGSGKSTLLRAISGLQPAERGAIRFGPTDVTLQAAHDRTRAGIVQLSGGRSSFGELTVRENFDVGGLRLDTELRRARIATSLELFPELRNLLDRRADGLSGGEQQMLGIARALLLDPELLLIDELSLGLAPLVVGRLVEALDDIRRQGASIVIVEQSLNLAAATADRVVFLDRGRIRFEGSGDDLLDRRDIARAVFLGGDA